MSDLITSSAYIPGSGQSGLGKINNYLTNGIDISDYLPKGAKVSDYYYDDAKITKDIPKVKLPDTTDDTEGLGLGKIFSDLTKEGGLLSQIGKVAGVGKGIFDIYAMGQDLFGSGRRDRKDAKDKMNRSFEQNYAMNDAAYKKFQDDLSIFRTGQANAKKSFETGSVDNPVKTV